MRNDGGYNCALASPAHTGEAAVYLGREGLDFRTEKAAFLLDYSRVRRFVLKNHRFSIETPSEPVALSQMGHDTEGFYKALWFHYNRRGREALFVETEPEREVEGEYAYQDEGGRAEGTAKLCLYPDCVLILPPDRGGRRVPLCFVQELALVNYSIRVALDTGERYELIRMGRDTKPFYERLTAFCGEARKKWRAAHEALAAGLEARLGEALPRYRFLQETCGADKVVTGLFSPEGGDFWIAAFGGGTAAVELVSGEKTATYLYRLTGGSEGFEARLRHAMEAVGLHREIIYLDGDELNQNPLYVMALERQPHLGFLRAHTSGRVIHTDAWEKKTGAALAKEV